MITDVNEIAERIYRLSTFVSTAGTAGFTFNQFLIDAEEPLLFHCGQRALFSSVAEAVSLPWPTRVRTLGRRFRRVGLWKTASCVRITLPGLTWKMAVYLTDQPCTHSHVLKPAHAMDRSKCVSP